jgi:putative membrane protein
MIRLLVRWVLNAAVLYLISFLVAGFYIDTFYAAIIAVLVLGIVNALIKPLLLLITLPINILTLGLFTFVINGLLFWFVATFVKGFNVDGFMPAFWAALLFSIFSIIISWLDQILTPRKSD